MSDTTERIEFKLVESDEFFWENLREISDRLGWETDQTLKACFAIGWDLLSQRVNCMQKDINDDDNELE